jgi:hypothetical protein
MERRVVFPAVTQGSENGRVSSKLCGGQGLIRVGFRRRLPHDTNGLAGGNERRRFEPGHRTRARDRQGCGHGSFVVRIFDDNDNVNFAERKEVTVQFAAMGLDNMRGGFGTVLRFGEQCFLRLVRKARLVHIVRHKHPPSLRRFTRAAALSST